MDRAELAKRDLARERQAHAEARREIRRLEAEVERLRTELDNLNTRRAA